jgi:hypothetical protein
MTLISIQATTKQAVLVIFLSTDYLLLKFCAPLICTTEDAKGFVLLLVHILLHPQWWRLGMHMPLGRHHFPDLMLVISLDVLGRKEILCLLLQKNKNKKNSTAVLHGLHFRI